MLLELVWSSRAERKGMVISMEGIEKGKYILYEELGSGGSGKVYRAFDRHLRCDRAVKKFTAGEEVWKKELEILKGLRHPLLPMITDFMEEDNDRYLVMEYIEGKNLEDYVKEKGHIVQDQAVEWAVELADLLIYLHERNSPVIYRDMKPANIIVEPDGKLKLVDFGTAWLRYQAGGEKFCVGTYGYAAPEQLGEDGPEGADERSDVYGLGATLYFMLTGDDPSQPPFLMHPIRFFDRRLSMELEKIVGKAVEGDKRKRYQTMRQFKTAMERYKSKDFMRECIGKGASILYYGILFGLSFLFAAACRFPRQEKRILIVSSLILSACLLRFFVFAGRGRGKRGICRERSILLTEKKGRGLTLLLVVVILSRAAVNVPKAFAKEENTLFVNVRNEKGQKILIQFDAVYPLMDALKLELPLCNFEKGGVYRLRLECMNCETEEKNSRTFYLKSIESE